MPGVGWFDYGARLIDGGSPSAAGPDEIDGGAPSPALTNIIDGGAA